MLSEWGRATCGHVVNTDLSPPPPLAFHSDVNISWSQSGHFLTIHHDTNELWTQTGWTSPLYCCDTSAGFRGFRVMGLNELTMVLSFHRTQVLIVNLVLCQYLNVIENVGAQFSWLNNDSITMVLVEMAKDTDTACVKAVYRELGISFVIWIAFNIIFPNVNRFWITWCTFQDHDESHNQMVKFWQNHRQRRGEFIM